MQALETFDISSNPMSRAVWRRVPGLLLPVYALLAALLLAIVLRDRSREREAVREEARVLTDLQADLISKEFEAKTATLLYMAEQKILGDFLADESTRPRLEQEYVRFCGLSQEFDQVRFLDLDGKEVVRVDYADGSPRALLADDLQAKGERYYFRAAFELEVGHVYVSPIDLNQEHGKIEQPWKPVLRLATPVSDPSGQRRGILVLNCLGRRMLDRLREIAARGRGWTGIVNQEGYYLEGPDRERSWSFLFGAAPSFARDHPQAWSEMQQRASGSLSSAEGLLCFQEVGLPRRVRAVTIETPTSLRMVTFVPDAELYRASTQTFQRLGLGTLVVALLGLLVALRLAHAGLLRANHERALAASERRLRGLSQRLLEAQEAERKSLARDLHDEIGQLATALTIDLERARPLREGPAKDALIDSALGTTARLLSGMHGLAGRLRSSLLDDLGLEAALRACVEELEARAALHVDLCYELEQEGTNEALREGVYRIVQEALTNVSRHAGAREVQVRVWQEGGDWRLLVRDSGVGFDPAQVDSSRMGQIGMRERAELLGGRLDVQSVPGEGTVVSACLPLQPPDSLRD